MCWRCSLQSACASIGKRLTGVNLAQSNAMSRILITMNEDTQASGERHFAVTYKVDEHDCLEYAAGLNVLGHDVYFVNWKDFDGRGFKRMFHDGEKRFVAPLS